MEKRKEGGKEERERKKKGRKEVSGQEGPPVHDASSSLLGGTGLGEARNTG